MLNPTWPQSGGCPLPVPRRHRAESGTRDAGNALPAIARRLPTLSTKVHMAERGCRSLGPAAASALGRMFG